MELTDFGKGLKVKEYSEQSTHGVLEVSIADFLNTGQTPSKFVRECKVEFDYQTETT
jgi:hypothetical protein